MKWGYEFEYAIEIDSLINRTEAQNYPFEVSYHTLQKPLQNVLLNGSNIYGK